MNALILIIATLTMFSFFFWIGYDDAPALSNFKSGKELSEDIKQYQKEKDRYKYIFFGFCVVLLVTVIIKYIL